MKQEYELEPDEGLIQCRFVKTVLMLIIVFYHSILWWGGEWFTAVSVTAIPSVRVLVKFLNSFHIYTFTLVSGYLFYHGKYECNKYRLLRSFIQIKVKRLIVPYVFVSVLWVIPIHSYFYRRDAIRYIVDFALGVSPNQLWFLLMLFNVFLLCYGLSDVFDRYTLFGGIISVFLYGIGICGKKVLPNVFQIWTACQYVFVFWVGFQMRKHRRAFFRKGVCIGITLTYVSLYLLHLMDNRLGPAFLRISYNYVVEFLLNGSGAVAAFLLFYEIGRSVNWQK